MKSVVVKRSAVISGHKTSVSFDDEPLMLLSPQADMDAALILIGLYGPIAFFAELVVAKVHPGPMGDDEGDF